MTQSEQLLKDLAEALDNAFISTWQTTAAWQKELDAALDYLKDVEEDSVFSAETKRLMESASECNKRIIAKYGKERQ